jgi:hypothetical protein
VDKAVYSAIQLPKPLRTTSLENNKPKMNEEDITIQCKLEKLSNLKKELAVVQELIEKRRSELRQCKNVASAD